MTIQDLVISNNQAFADSNQKPLVLVIDDDEDNLLLLQYSLEFFDCQCLAKRDGSNLTSLVQDVQPDLILLDIVMPRQSGIELLHELRENAHTQHIPAVAITALGRMQDRLWLLAEGFDDYLSKPFTIDRLKETIDRYCYQTRQK